jgi:hypothetical protein
VRRDGDGEGKMTDHREGEMNLELGLGVEDRKGFLEEVTFKRRPDRRVGVNQQWGISV